MLKTSLHPSEDAEQRSLDILDELEDLDAPYKNTSRMIFLLHYLYHTNVISKQFGSGDIVNFIRENSNHRILRKLSFDKNFIEETNKNGNPVYRTINVIKKDKKFLVQSEGSRTLCFQTDLATIKRMYPGGNKPYNFNTILKNSASHIAKKSITVVSYAEDSSNGKYAIDDAEYIPTQNSSGSANTPRRSSREVKTKVFRDYAFFESSDSDDSYGSGSLSPSYSTPSDDNETDEAAETLLSLIDCTLSKKEDPTKPDLKTDEDLTDYFNHLDDSKSYPFVFYQLAVNTKKQNSRKEPCSSIETTDSKRVKINFLD